MYTPGLAMAVTCTPCDRQITQISSPDTVCHFALSFQSACNCKCPQKKSTNAAADKRGTILGAALFLSILGAALFLSEPGKISNAGFGSGFLVGKPYQSIQLNDL
jgi:hypothetical protein